jgi:hypothetical protein
MVQKGRWPGSATTTNMRTNASKIPESGEVGALSQIVNTGPSLLYWEPMRRYFSKSPEVHQ